jgi:two-component system NtrC family sensor kinase
MGDIEISMFDQVLDNLRKATDSTIHLQQEMFRQWFQQWPQVLSIPTTGTMLANSWADQVHAFERDWSETVIDMLNKHRETLDSQYRAGIQDLRRAYDELERRVEERTAELSRTNTLLKQEIIVRQRAEEALRTSERLYRQLTEGSRDAIVVADEQGIITLFNPAAQRIFGYEEREVLGGPLLLLMPPEDQANHQQTLRRPVEPWHSRLVGRTIELQGRRKSGEIFPLEISLSAIELPEGVVFLGAIRDLTDRRRLQARVVQAEKLASLGLLSAGVAHEINNPLAYVANNLAVLERDYCGLSEVLAAYEEARPALEAPHPELAERIARIAEEIDLPYIRVTLRRLLSSTRQGVKRVSDIVQNLREFARLGQATIDQVDVHEAIASSLEMIRGRLERRHIKVEEHYGELPRIVCAPAQIHQVILNLLVNAMQAIESTGRAGGRIEISTRACRAEVILAIADDGCGIPEEIRSRIFDPFFTTKPVGQGTGLGLAISHGIVTDHGGRIEVESQPGRGSCFRVILPAGGRGQVHEYAAQALPGGGGQRAGDLQLGLPPAVPQVGPVPGKLP